MLCKLECVAGWSLRHFIFQKSLSIVSLFSAKLLFSHLQLYSSLFTNIVSGYFYSGISFICIYNSPVLIYRFSVSWIYDFLVWTHALICLHWCLWHEKLLFFLKAAKERNFQKYSLSPSHENEQDGWRKWLEDNKTIRSYIRVSFQ